MRPGPSTGCSWPRARRPSARRSPSPAASARCSRSPRPRTADLRDRAAAASVPVAARRRRGAGLAEPRPSTRRGWSRSAASSTCPSTDVLAARPRLVAVCADVRDPGNAGTVIRCADAAGAGGVVLTGEQRRPLQRQGRAGRRPARCSTCRSPSSPTRAATVAALRARGLTVLAADGPASVDLDDAVDDGLLAGRPPGCSATRPGGCPTSSPRSPTTGCGSRSTAAPRASTWPPPPPSASTPRARAQRPRRTADALTCSHDHSHCRHGGDRSHARGRQRCSTRCPTASWSPTPTAWSRHVNDVAAAAARHRRRASASTWPTWCALQDLAGNDWFTLHRRPTTGSTTRTDAGRAGVVPLRRHRAARHRPDAPPQPAPARSSRWRSRCARPGPATGSTGSAPTWSPPSPTSCARR